MKGDSYNNIGGCQAVRTAITGEIIDRDSMSVNKLSKYFMIALLTLKGALNK